jgi:hypothetical protein
MSNNILYATSLTNLLLYLHGASFSQLPLLQTRAAMATLVDLGFTPEKSHGPCCEIPVEKNQPTTPSSSAW